MIDLNYEITGAAPQRFAAIPLLAFGLRVTEAARNGDEPTPVHSVALRCQVRIEPARRRYDAAEQRDLLDVFGTPDRWGQTLKPLLWTHVTTIVPPFTGSGSAELLVPCSTDFTSAATRYFAALRDGELPLSFLFSGTVFHDRDGELRVAPIPWDKEARYRLPAESWRQLIDAYYADSHWLCVRSHTCELLDELRRRHGLATREDALDRLVSEYLEPIPS